jgi:hypothetical protein
MALNGIPISEDQCIGDSLLIINSSFQSLDARSTTLSSSLKTTYTDLTGNGSTTSFVFNGYSTDQPERYLVHVGGLYQRPGFDYTVSSGHVNFTIPPPNGSTTSVLALF